MAHPPPSNPIARRRIRSPDDRSTGAPPFIGAAAVALCALGVSVGLRALGDLTGEVTLGIDLGTTYSVAATCEAGSVRVVTPPRGSIARRLSKGGVYASDDDDGGGEADPVGWSSPSSELATVPSVVHFGRRTRSTRSDGGGVAVPLKPLGMEHDGVGSRGGSRWGWPRLGGWASLRGVLRGGGWRGGGRIDDGDVDGGWAVVGEAAARLRDVAPERTVYDAKRLIGRRRDDPIVVEEAAHLPFAVVDGGGTLGECAIAIPADGASDERSSPPTLVSPEEVGARILLHLKRAAESSLHRVRRVLGFSFGSLTVSVPVGFSKSQRAATIRAGTRAGFRVVRLLEEPVAAAIAYGLHEDDRERLVVVYDLGGGTLDVAVLRLERASRTFLVMGVAGDPHLGGEDFDRALVEWLRGRLSGGGEGGTAAEAEAAFALPDASASNELALRAVERAKRMLSASDAATLRVCRSGDGGALTIEALPADAVATGDDACRMIVLTRAALIEACASLLDRAVAPVAEALRRAGGVAPSEVDDVVLVGGGTRLVAVRERLSDAFGGRQLHHSVDPDTAIAVGAARSYAC